MKNKIILGAVVASLLVSVASLASTVDLGFAWTDSGKKIVNKLTNNGYHDVIVLYNQPLRCNGKLDQNSGGFRAISKENHIVEGVVCGDGIYIKKQTITEK